MSNGHDDVEDDVCRCPMCQPPQPDLFECERQLMLMMDKPIPITGPPSQFVEVSNVKINGHPVDGPGFITVQSWDDKEPRRVRGWVTPASEPDS